MESYWEKFGMLFFPSGCFCLLIFGGGSYVTLSIIMSLGSVGWRVAAENAVGKPFVRSLDRAPLVEQ